MKRLLPRTCFPVVLTALLAGSSQLAAGVIDFENLTDGTFVTTQYAGVIFSNAVIATAGISLNELEFPPNSGSNVVIDGGGPITVDFAAPISSFGAYFTYLEPVTIQGFGASNNLLASSTSLFSNNLACLDGPPCQGNPGSTPDEFIQVSSMAGFSSVVVTGDPNGSSYAMDDVTYTTTQVGSPEPSSLWLAVSGALFVVVRRTGVASVRFRG